MLDALFSSPLEDIFNSGQGWTDDLKSKLSGLLVQDQEPDKQAVTTEDSDICSRLRTLVERQALKKSALVDSEDIQQEMAAFHTALEEDKVSSVLLGDFIDWILNMSSSDRHFSAVFLIFTNKRQFSRLWTVFFAKSEHGFSGDFLYRTLLYINEDIYDRFYETLLDKMDLIRLFCKEKVSLFSLIFKDMSPHECLSVQTSVFFADWSFFFEDEFFSVILRDSILNWESFQQIFMWKVVKTWLISMSGGLGFRYIPTFFSNLLSSFSSILKERPESDSVYSLSLYAESSQGLLEIYLYMLPLMDAETKARMSDVAKTCLELYPDHPVVVISNLI